MTNCIQCRYALLKFEFKVADFWQVLVGNVLINPEVLRSILKKSHYYARYEKDKDLLTFSVSDGYGGETVFQIRNISHESARKLAEGLGLKADSRYPEQECSWSKWNPVYKLYHNESLEAEEIRMEALRLGLSLIIKNISSDAEWVFCYDIFEYRAKHYGSKDRVIEILREQAVRYAANLATTP